MSGNTEKQVKNETKEEDNTMTVAPQSLFYWGAQSSANWSLPYMHIINEVRVAAREGRLNEFFGGEEIFDLPVESERDRGCLCLQGIGVLANDIYETISCFLEPESENTEIVKVNESHDYRFNLGQCAVIHDGGMRLHIPNIGNVTAFKKSTESGTCIHVLQIVIPDPKKFESSLIKIRDVQVNIMAHKSSTTLWVLGDRTHIVIVTDDSSDFYWSTLQWYRKVLSDLALVELEMVANPTFWKRGIFKKLTRTQVQFKKLYRAICGPTDPLDGPDAMIDQWKLQQDEQPVWCFKAYQNYGFKCYRVREDFPNSRTIIHISNCAPFDESEIQKTLKQLVVELHQEWKAHLDVLLEEGQNQLNTPPVPEVTNQDIPIADKNVKQEILESPESSMIDDKIEIKEPKDLNRNLIDNNVEPEDSSMIENSNKTDEPKSLNRNFFDVDDEPDYESQPVGPSQSTTTSIFGYYGRQKIQNFPAARPLTEQNQTRWTVKAMITTPELDTEDKDADDEYETDSEDSDLIPTSDNFDKKLPIERENCGIRKLTSNGFEIEESDIESQIPENLHSHVSRTFASPSLPVRPNTAASFGYRSGTMEGTFELGQRHTKSGRSEKFVHSNWNVLDSNARFPRMEESDLWNQHDLEEQKLLENHFIIKKKPVKIEENLHPQDVSSTLASPRLAVRPNTATFGFESGTFERPREFEKRQTKSGRNEKLVHSKRNVWDSSPRFPRTEETTDIWNKQALDEQKLLENHFVVKKKSEKVEEKLAQVVENKTLIGQKNCQINSSILAKDVFNCGILSQPQNRIDGMFGNSTESYSEIQRPKLSPKFPDTFAIAKNPKSKSDCFEVSTEEGVKILDKEIAKLASERPARLNVNILSNVNKRSERDQESSVEF